MPNYWQIRNKTYSILHFSVLLLKCPKHLLNYLFNLRILRPTDKKKSLYLFSKGTCNISIMDFESDCYFYSALLTL